MDQNEALKKITDWAETDESIRAVIVTGSVAAGEADRWSDLDVEVFARDPASLLENDAWYATFGEVLVVEALPNPGWFPTRLVYYVGGKIDFAIAPVDALGSARYERPFRVVVDKDLLTGGLRADMAPASLPSRAMFTECNNWFWAAALMCAKSAVRDEPWEAKNRDVDLKENLLRMIEWDHRARHGSGLDTWHLGKRMTRWMDPDVRDALAACWGRFDAADTIRALRHSVDLFRASSERTAQTLGLPPFDSSRAEAELDRIVREVADC